MDEWCFILFGGAAFAQEHTRVLRGRGREIEGVFNWLGASGGRVCVVCAGRSVQEQQSVCNLYNEYTVCALSQHCLAAASDECRKRASLAASMPPSHRIRLESGVESRLPVTNVVIAAKSVV